MRPLQKISALVLLSMCANCTPEVLDNEDAAAGQDGAALPEPTSSTDAGDASRSTGPEAGVGHEAGPGSETGCFSPSANLDSAGTEGSVGCSCSTAPDGSVDPNDPLGYYFADNAKCVINSFGSHVALFCTEGRWVAGHDGPCSPYLVHLHECYSPSANLDKAYERYSIGCSCDPATDASVCVADGTGRNVALICENRRWKAVEDGPCLP